MDLVDVFLQILSDHHLSQRAVCDIVGFSSTNHLTRILKRQVSHKLLVRFGQLLLEHRQALALTEDEVASLQACCISSSLTTDDQTAASLFYSILFRPHAPSQAADLTLMDVSGKRLGSFQGVFGDARALTLAINGCLDTPLCSILDAMSARCTLRADYYLPEGQTNTQSAKYLRLTWSFLYKPWFHPHGVRADARFAGLCCGDGAFIDADFSSGERRSFLLLPLTESTAYLLPFPADHLPFPQLLFGSEERIYTLHAAPQERDSYAHYLQYLKNMEHNHGCFLIKAEMCLHMIPPDIQLCALKEGPMADYPGVDEALPTLYELEKARFENNRDKKKHQYYLHTEKGLRHFMETGMESDHFWGFRPFTPEERYATLRELYERAVRSPYMHLYLLKPGLEPVSDEIVWYENHGISLVLPNTHYHIGRDHAELLFRDPAFCRFFSGYFRKWFCQNYAFSEEESLTTLHALLSQFAPHSALTLPTTKLAHRRGDSTTSTALSASRSHP